MIRLHVIAEGPTERFFVSKVLKSHLSNFGVYADARAVLTSKDNKAAKEYRGGMISYGKTKADIETWMKQDNHPECRFTTMFDLYALPDDFPGYADAKKCTNPYEKVQLLENALAKDIEDWRFIPYIQLHEFEALILADPQQLDWEYLEQEGAISRLREVVGDRNPESINETPTGAPSKLILKEIPGYDKTSTGPSVVEKIGLPVLRDKCMHFSEWVTRLEHLDEAITTP